MGQKKGLRKIVGRAIGRRVNKSAEAYTPGLTASDQARNITRALINAHDIFKLAAFFGDAYRF
ncbi:hypothetical protein MJ579_24960 [Klebsiella pneumoniae]|nr:hypothetical protein MJ579_24960 [Klebsiella pneumoniae]